MAVPAAGAKAVHLGWIVTDAGVIPPFASAPSRLAFAPAGPFRPGRVSGQAHASVTAGAGYNRPHPDRPRARAA